MKTTKTWKEPTTNPKQIKIGYYTVYKGQAYRLSVVGLFNPDPDVIALGNKIALGFKFIKK